MRAKVIDERVAVIVPGYNEFGDFVATEHMLSIKAAEEFLKELDCAISKAKNITNAIEKS